MSLFAGPRPQSRAARTRVLESILARLVEKYGREIRAIGLYGSMARGSDLPFSDIELFCVLEGAEIDHTFEWVYGPSKAEVNVYSLDVARDLAQEVDEWWPLAQGAFLNAKLLYGDPGILAELRELVMAPPDVAFTRAIQAMVVGELYEWMGKLRNARMEGQAAAVPALACQFAHFTAVILGLAHRTCYSTGSRLFAESLALPRLPDGYPELCRLVTTGRLDDADEVIDSVERLWRGLEPWGASLELGFESLGRGDHDVLQGSQD